MINTLFDNASGINEKIAKKLPENEANKSVLQFQDIQKNELNNESPANIKNRIPIVDKIVWFYDNNSFEEYFPKR